jgi:hypothetical protein
LPRIPDERRDFIEVLPTRPVEIGEIWGDGLLPKWRATVDEDGQYSFAVAL